MADTHLFQFKQFNLHHAHSMKVGTDSVLLGAWAAVEGATSVLDVGTGSGVLALMVAQRTSASTHIDAIELNPNAAAEARKNFLQSPWHSRLALIEGDFLRWKTLVSYDLIISNPPYFENSLLPPNSARSAARHTVALHAWAILDFAHTHLSPSGTVNLVLPAREGEVLIQQVAQLPLYLTRQCQVRSRPQKPVERLLLEFSSTPKQVAREELVLHTTHHARSEAYQQLTHPFYTKG
jgi:tRNA1Val (adenine37-N6)-methyltransferase